MRTIVKLVLSLAVAACFGVAATPAFAEPEWEACASLEEKIGNFEDSKCSKEKSGGEFEWVSASGGVSQTVKLQALTLLLSDTKATGGSSAVRCGHPTVGWGLVFNTNLLLVKVAKVESPTKECERVEGGCKAGEVEVVEGVHLPWKTELFGTEKKVLSKILADGSGEPGWEIRCNTLLGKVTDECTSEAGSPEELELTNEVSSGTVLGTLKKAHKAKCSVGGAGAGEEAGAVKIEGNGGQGVRAQTGREFAWKKPERSLLPPFGLVPVTLRATEKKELKKNEAHNTVLKLEGTEGGKTFKVECPEIVIEGEIIGGRAGTYKDTLTLKKCKNFGAPQCTVENEPTIISRFPLSAEIVEGVQGPGGNSSDKDLILLKPEKVTESFFVPFNVTGTGCTTVTINGNVLLEARNARALVKILKIKGEPLENKAYLNSNKVEHTAGLTSASKTEAKLLGETEFKLEGEAEFGIY